MPAIRPVRRLIVSIPTSDGAGVRLRRSIGTQAASRVDPFLMLDEFSSEDAADYIAGFPDHPHRGFETITYMLDGRMRHEDHLGNRGVLGPGGVQWMIAGRGIVHSEMPEQQSGRMRGFQIWLNLPSHAKMQAAWYRDIAPEQVPQVTLEGGAALKLIAGRWEIDGRTHAGAIGGERWEHTTDPLLADLALPAHTTLTLSTPPGHQVFVYVFEGVAQIGPPGLSLSVPAHAGAVLGAGDAIGARTEGAAARLLILGGRPLNEPIAQYGPFVMNTPGEIEQAIRDFRSGRLTEPG